MLDPSLNQINDEPLQLKRTAKLLTVIAFTTKHADYRITYVLYHRWNTLSQRQHAERILIKVSGRNYSYSYHCFPFMSSYCH